MTPETTVLGMAISAIGAMTAVIRILWLKVDAQMSRTERRIEEAEKRLDECEDDRTELRVEARMLKDEILHLKARMTTQEEA